MGGFGAAASTTVKYIPTPFKTNAAVEGVKQINETAGNCLAAVFELLEMEEEGSGLENPMFVSNGHDGPSPNTARYFRAKRALKITSTIAVNLADVGGLASTYQAGSYGLMWHRLNALFEKLVPPSRRAKAPVYAHWYSWEVAKKGVSAGSLETRMRAIIRQKMYGAAGGATKAGITFGTGGVTGYFVNSIAGWLTPYFDQVFSQDAQALGQGLHWFAFLENVVGRGRARGPATRILEVLWTELALGKTSGVTLQEIIPEPRGWLVIADLVN